MTANHDKTIREGTTMAGPLAGLRIIDCTTVVQSRILTPSNGPAIDVTSPMLSPEVPQVGRACAGNVTRQLGPARHPGMAAFYLGCNRSKRSIVLDLKQPSGLKALFKLAETADVLMHNYRPEPAKRLGVEYEKFE